MLLVSPEAGIRLGKRGLRASFMSVPKAAVNEDDFAASRKDEIGTAGQILAVKSESISETV